MGYQTASEIPKIQIFYNTTADHKMIAENIQSQLKKKPRTQYRAKQSRVENLSAKAENKGCGVISPGMAGRLP